MRRAVGIVVVIAGSLVLAQAWAQRADVQAQPALATQPPPAVKPLVLSDGLIALSSDTADGHQQVIVVDTKTRGMTVYHIDHKTGVSTLKSARNIQADLEMDEFNTESPLPREIRAVLNKR